MPIVVPVAVTNAPVSAASVAFAIPKSAIFTPPAAGDHQVLRLEVAVDDAELLGRGEPGEQPLEHAADLRERHPADVRPQRAALEVLHRDVGHPRVLEVVEHGDHVRVHERAREPRLADEAPREVRIRGMEGRQLLERDEAIEVGLAREIHDRHPAPAELAQDSVAPNGPHQLRHGATVPLAR